MSNFLTTMPLTYFTYLAVSIPLTIWVGRQLHNHGRIFLERGYANQKELAASIGQLLSVGFYLLHVGFILLAMKLGGHVVDTVSAIELLSTKLGIVLMVLAVSNFLYLAKYTKFQEKPIQAECSK